MHCNSNKDGDYNFGVNNRNILFAGLTPYNFNRALPRIRNLYSANKPSCVM